MKISNEMGSLSHWHLLQSMWSMFELWTWNWHGCCYAVLNQFHAFGTIHIALFGTAPEWYTQSTRRSGTVCHVLTHCQKETWTKTNQHLPFLLNCLVTFWTQHAAWLCGFYSVIHLLPVYDNWHQQHPNWGLRPVYCMGRVSSDCDPKLVFYIMHVCIQWYKYSFNSLNVDTLHCALEM